MAVLLHCLSGPRCECARHAGGLQACCCAISMSDVVGPAEEVLGDGCPSCMRPCLRRAALEVLCIEAAADRHSLACTTIDSPSAFGRRGRVPEIRLQLHSRLDPAERALTPVDRVCLRGRSEYELHADRSSAVVSRRGGRSDRTALLKQERSMHSCVGTVRCRTAINARPALKQA